MLARAPRRRRRPSPTHTHPLLLLLRALRAAAIEAKSGYRGVRARAPHPHTPRLSPLSCSPSLRPDARPARAPQVGVVKLMGRQSGFIATYASIASGEVDVCLIPEVPFVMDGAPRPAPPPPPPHGAAGSGPCVRTGSDGL